MVMLVHVDDRMVRIGADYCWGAGVHVGVGVKATQILTILLSIHRFALSTVT